MTVSLPVLANHSARGSPGSGASRSRVAKWRVVALIGVHVAIGVHLLHWWWSGRTLGRFVMSDSMQTLERGEINPGFLLFAGALLLTAFAGRFMCGWACHMGALQDLCAWLLRRVGVRPHIFRSRVLGYAPLAMAIYMFVWPTLWREAGSPALTAMWPDASERIGNAGAFPGLSWHLRSDRLWEGLPSAWIAVPFLLLCGCATVYFLGARGLCRYGCPYGGLLLGAEQLAPIRVAVDSMRCDQCGLCTAACTAGVRVHDEVRKHGAVLDRSCVRSLDCVSVCPQSALSLRVGKPALFVRGAHTGAEHLTPDLSLRQELIAGAAGLATLLIVRGLYGLIPLLLAGTVAVVVAFLLVRTLQARSAENSRVGGIQVRLRGRATVAGRLFSIVMIGLCTFLAHSALIRGMTWWAEHLDGRITVAYTDAVAGAAPPEQRVLAYDALRWYERATSLSRGGIGLARTPASAVRIAWLRLVVGQPERAAEELISLCTIGRGSDHAAVEAARILLSLNRPQDAAALLGAWVRENPAWIESRELHSVLLARAGRADEAIAACRARLTLAPRDAGVRSVLARALQAAGRTDEALHEAASAAAETPGDPSVRIRFAAVLFESGRLEEALAELESCARARPIARDWLRNVGAQMLQRAGQPDRCAQWSTRMSR